jgi:hypothetical protein
MVGPLTEEDRAAASLRLRVGIVALVGASGGLVALYGGGNLLGVAAGVAGGLVLGILLVWYLVWITR